jgi:drug/metabolite transporter (DMT)-like permease
MSKYIFLSIITISEATIGVFVKLTEGNIPIFSLNFYRVLFALVFIIIFIPFIDKEFWKLKRDNFKPVIIIGALIALQISLFNYAMSIAPIANVVIFWSISPFFVFLLSSFFLNEKVKKEHILVFVIAFIGLIIAKPLSSGYAIGNTISIFGGAVYAALITYMRYEGKTDQANLVFWYMLTATIILFPFLLIFEVGDLMKLIYYPSIGISLPVIFWVICLGMFSTGVAYFFITLVLKNIKAAVYSLVDVIVSPVVAGLFGYFIFNETPSSHTIIGGAFLILSGFILTAYMRDHDKHFIKKFIDVHIRRIEPDVIDKISENKTIK